ncbi:pectate lyase [Alienimonas chondri]|uniref:pectate lyase n=1 Tax=Alienimonas chondri TaxID=2681879 RepID=UPI001489D950|nr:pectate lyase [Alienimonas chondri]
MPLLLTTLCGVVAPASAADDPGRDEARDALRRAGRFFAKEVALRGGYVYFVELDRPRRWGEGEATATQIWVQPPATPTVGEAFLNAYEATGDAPHLAAATAAGEALVYGQLKSGGWTNRIDFDPNGNPADYRNGRGRGRNTSSLDDGQTPAALRLLIRLDAAHDGRHAAIAEAVRTGLDALLAAQFPGGGFPQVWDDPEDPPPTLRAVLPEGDWRELPRVKNYWDQATLNDGLAGQVVDTLLLARTTYLEREPPLAERCDAAVRRLGDFLIRAQLPRPQPAWAQQYDAKMRPAWARIFEPPAVVTSESQDVIEALLTLHAATGDPQFLDPIPAALDYLDRSALPDGQLPRYLELNTNRPLYMQRDGGGYRPTFDDTNLPGHYGWKIGSRVETLRNKLQRAQSGRPPSPPNAVKLADAARRAIDALDDEGRWVETSDGSKLVGQAKIPVGSRFLASETFADNMSALAAFLRVDAPAPR